MAASATKFWELAGIFLSVAQMIISLERVEKYEDKLEEMADVLFKCGDACPGESLAVKHRCRYRDLRALDAGFKAWYDSVPKYDMCEIGTHRGKGAASYALGSTMRKLVKMNNGYTPLAMVGKVSAGSMGFGKMEDEILHWNKVVSIPVEQEGNYTNFDGPIKIALQNMANWGQGFNSGAAGLGNSLYGLLHSGNQNQMNLGPIPTSEGSRTRIDIGPLRVVP